MKWTKWEAEYLLEQVTAGIRKNVSQKKSTKRLEKLADKIEHYLTQKGLPTK